MLSVEAYKEPRCLLRIEASKGATEAEQATAQRSDDV